MVRRSIALLVAMLVAVGLGVPTVVAARPAPKVVIIVGPVGASTPTFRAQADAAAAAAARYTTNVVKVYSPNATWPAVNSALQGASVVVYLGHGNGWPSRYRDYLYGVTQNGFGLNPVAGQGDAAHQYFGENAVGSQIRLAKNAVVLLSHLCYASGNTEPGLPEGTIGQARQRIDNYAAGFIRAGARAVLAEAYGSPAYFVRAALQSGSSLQAAWRTAPSANGHASSFASSRSRGYLDWMDPERSGSGFTRSLVVRGSLSSSDVRAGAEGSAAAGTSDLPAAPSLASAGLTIRTPQLAAVPTAGAKTTLKLGFKARDRKALPKALQASVRWDPIDVPVPADPANEVAGSSPAPTSSEATAGPSGTAGEASPRASGDPAAAATIDAADPGTAPKANGRGRRPAAGPPPEPPPLLPPPPPDELALVQPEQLGDVVSPVKTSFGKTVLGVRVALPKAPGLYRLTVTLHDRDGVAYDPATQALVPTVLVRVTGDPDGRVLAPDSATLEAGSSVPLALRVANLGRSAWGEAASKDGGPARADPATWAVVVGRWVPLGNADTDPAAPLPSATSRLPTALKAGHTVDASVGLTVPDRAGEYLLVLDINTPEAGSLAALGVPTAIVHVTVVAAR